MDTSFKNLIEQFRENIKIIFLITFLSSLIGIVYAFLVTPIYKSELYMISTDQTTTGLGGGNIQALASQFGLGAGIERSPSSPLYGKRIVMKILSSRDFTLSFLEDNNLMYFLYPDKWDLEKNTWKEDILIPNHESIMRNMNETRVISEDLQSGIILYSLESPFPEFATSFLNDSVKGINTKIREMSKEDGKKNITYLEEELQKTNLVQAQIVLSAMLREEKQNLMLANTREDFAFKVIDKAIIPNQKFKPSRRTIAIASFFFGLLFSFFYVLYANHRITEEDQ